jgi:PTH1 family peptidyl-tRNA hydrolase
MKKQIYFKIAFLSTVWHNSCTMKLIIGLGNPGKKYDQTRHNVGFLVVDEMAKQMKIDFKNKTSFEAEVAEPDSRSVTSPLIKGEHEGVVLLKPQTYMNVSGRSVKAYMSKNKCQASDLVVLYDDADIPFGDVRFKQAGSSGGHNGMQSILDIFPKGTSIARVRVGIGRPPNPDMPLDKFVLQKLSAEEKKKLPEIIEKAIEKVREWKSQKAQA